MANILISMPDEFIKKLDKAAQAELRSRSEFLREAVRFYLEQKKIEV